MAALLISLWWTMDYTYSFQNATIATVQTTAAEANQPDCWISAKTPSSPRNHPSWESVPLNSPWYKDGHLRQEFSRKKGRLSPFRQEGFVTSLKGDPWGCLQSKPIDNLPHSVGAGTWKCQQSLNIKRMDGNGQFRPQDHTDEKGSLMPATFPRCLPMPKGDRYSSTDSFKTLLYTTSTERGREILQNPLHKSQCKKPSRCRVLPGWSLSGPADSETMWIFADRLTWHSAGSHNQTRDNVKSSVATTGLQDPACSESSTHVPNLTGLPKQPHLAHANPFTGNN